MNTKALTKLAGAALTAFSMGYAWCSKKKVDTLEGELTDKVDKLIKNGTVSIEQSVVDNAIRESIDKHVDICLSNSIHQTCASTASLCVTNIQDEINKRAKEAVDREFATMSEPVRAEITRRLANIDMDGLKRRIVSNAEDAMQEKLKTSMDDILSQFNKNLSNIGDIYKSISDTMRPK